MRSRALLVAAAVVALAACGGDDGPGTVDLYDRAPVPAVPDRTQPVTSPLADGDYWAELSGMSDDDQSPNVVFHLTQAFFAAACLEDLGADECPNDYGVLADPSLDVDAPIADLASVTVVAEGRQNYAISGRELLEVARGTAPADAAPDDYRFVEFPFLVTIREGRVVEAHQIWVP